MSDYKKRQIDRHTTTNMQRRTKIEAKKIFKKIEPTQNVMVVKSKK